MTNCLAALIVAALATSASAEPQVVLRVNDQVTAEPPIQHAKAIRSLRAAGSDAFAMLVETESGDAIFGSYHGQAPRVLLRPLSGSTDVNGEDQRRFEDQFGLSPAGLITYSALLTRKPTGDIAVPGFIDSLWRFSPSEQAQVLLSRRGAVVNVGEAPNEYYVFASLGGCTNTGIPYWTAGVSATPTGMATGRRVLMSLGSSRKTLLQTGEVLPGTLGVVSPDRGIRWSSVSPAGTTLYAVVSALPAEGPATTAIVQRRVSQSPMPPITVLVAAGQPVPGSLIEGEKWLAFSRVQGVEGASCSGAVEWVGLAQTNASPDRDSVLVVDGQVRLREGETYGGWRLIDSPAALTMNESGDYLVLWRAAPSPGGAWKWVLLCNGTPVMWTGQTLESNDEVGIVYPHIAMGNRDGGGSAPAYAIARLATGDAVLRITITGARLCCPVDIADDQGYPLSDPNRDPNVPNTGVNEGDYNAFFQGFFDALPYCDMAADDGSTLPSSLPNTGVNEGDYNFFFSNFFGACM